MALIEFGYGNMSLERYLEIANSDVFDDHDDLTNILDTLDPRKQINRNLSDRLHPLTPVDMANLKTKAFIVPADTIEIISSKEKPDERFYVGESPKWYEIYGDFANTVEVKRLNIRLTTIKSGDWQLLCLISKTTSNYLNHPEKEFDFNIGWVHKEELDELRQIAAAS